MWAEVAHVSMGLDLGASAEDDVSAGDWNGMTAFVDWVGSGRLSVWLASWEEFREFGNLRSCEVGIGKHDGADVGAVRVFGYNISKFGLGTSGSNDAAVGLQVARVLVVGEVEAEVGSTAIVQTSGDGGTAGSSKGTKVAVYG